MSEKWWNPDVVASVAESAFLDVIHAGFERSPEISIFSPGI